MNSLLEEKGNFLVKLIYLKKQIIMKTVKFLSEILAKYGLYLNEVIKKESKKIPIKFELSWFDGFYTEIFTLSD